MHIMIAVDDTERSIDTINTARRLFGDDTDYTIASIGEPSTHLAAYDPVGLTVFDVHTLEVDEATRAAARATARVRQTTGNDVVAGAAAGGGKGGRPCATPGARADGLTACGDRACTTREPWRSPTRRRHRGGQRHQRGRRWVLEPRHTPAGRGGPVRRVAGRQAHRRGGGGRPPLAWQRGEAAKRRDTRYHRNPVWQPRAPPQRSRVAGGGGTGAPGRQCSGARCRIHDEGVFSSRSLVFVR